MNPTTMKQFISQGLTLTANGTCDDGYISLGSNSSECASGQCISFFSFSFSFVFSSHDTFLVALNYEDATFLKDIRGKQGWSDVVPSSWTGYKLNNCSSFFIDDMRHISCKIQGHTAYIENMFFILRFYNCNTTLSQNNDWNSSNQ